MDESLIWADVKGYEGSYSVSYCGKIYSHPRFNCNGRILKPYDTFGYLRVGLHKNKHTKTTKVHRIVAIAFVPNPNNYKIVNHKDGVKTNNHADNLEWTTSKGNIRHAWATGLLKALKGEANGNSKISDDNRLLLVRDYALTALTQHELAVRYGISQANVSVTIKAFLKQYFEKGEAIDSTKL